MAANLLVKRSIMLSEDEDTEVNALWHKECRRSRSEMLRMLVREALDARKAIATNQAGKLGKHLNKASNQKV